MSTSDDLRKMLEALDVGRTLEQQDRTHRDAMRRVLLRFLEVLDALDRLVEARRSASHRSLRALQRQFAAALEAAGVTFIETVGCPFDPHKHEADGTERDPGHAPGTVASQLRRGCEWEGQLLRPARVAVAAAPDDKEETDGSIDRH